MTSHLPCKSVQPELLEVNRAPTFSGLWPLRQVLEYTTIGRSQWLIGVKQGIYPSPVRLSKRRIAWKAAEVRAFVEGLS